MRVLEHRRHSRRDPGGLHLNEAGVALARRVGATLGPFARVVTSPIPRAAETVVELGLRADAEVPGLGVMPDDANFPGDPARLTTFQDYVDLYERSERMREFAQGQLDLWSRELEQVPEGGRLLLISHGGLIESGAVAAVGRRAAGWGPLLGYLEGVRLVREGDRWTGGEPLRTGP
jgi:broad specificity phosphatase PhoE